jgi:hypothetical protein
VNLESNFLTYYNYDRERERERGERERERERNVLPADRPSLEKNLFCSVFFVFKSFVATPMVPCL